MFAGPKHVKSVVSVAPGSACSPCIYVTCVCIYNTYIIYIYNFCISVFCSLHALCIFSAPSLHSHMRSVHEHCHCILYARRNCMNYQRTSGSLGGGGQPYQHHQLDQVMCWRTTTTSGQVETHLTSKEPILVVKARWRCYRRATIYIYI